MSKPRTPFATLALILGSLVAAFFTLTNPDSLLRWGYIPVPLGEPGFAGRLWTAVTSLFVHLDPLHLLGNMLVLAAVGPAVERAAGTWKVLVVFFVAGLVGVAAHHLAATSVMPAVAGEALAGSSGAIAGLIGYAWLRFHRSRVPILPNLWIPVWAVILVWLCLQVGGAFFSASQFGSTVAYFSHLAGFAAGFAQAFPMGAKAAATDEAWREHLEQASQRGTAARAAALKKAGGLDSVSQLAAELESHGEIESAVKCYASLVAQSESHAANAATRLAALGRLADVPREDRLRAAASMARDHRDTALLLLDSLACEPADRLTPSALEAQVGLLAGRDPRAAKVAAQRLVNEYGLSPEADRIRAKFPGLA